MKKVPLDLLYERLASLDPNDVLELLHITSKDLCDAFKSLIKKYREELSSELDLDIEIAFSHEDDDTFENYDDVNTQDFIIEEKEGDDDAV